MRTSQAKSFLLKNEFAVTEDFLQGIVSTVNNGVEKIETIENISPVHSLEIEDNVAIISVDGAMTKKNTWINAMCGGFASYDILSQYIDRAERNDNVDTILFNIDTPGGMVAGVDEVGEKIFKSSKKTITYYNNLGASAGVWAFSASDELFAGETALVGSIGVIVTYTKDRNNREEVTLLSKRAENKASDSTKKMQERINNIEDIFYSRVSRNTGLSKDTIQHGFNSGDVISSTKAHQLGFLKGVTTFDNLLKSLKKGGQDIEHKNTVSNNEKSIENTEEQVSMLQNNTSDKDICYNNGETNKNKEKKKMDINQLKAEHPAVYGEAFKLGASSEKDRINAHIEMAKETGATEFALECIGSGEALSQTAIAKYTTFGLNKKDVENKVLDNVEEIHTANEDLNVKENERNEALAKALRVDLKSIEKDS